MVFEGAWHGSHVSRTNIGIDANTLRLLQVGWNKVIVNIRKHLTSNDLDMTHKRNMYSHTLSHIYLQKKITHRTFGGSAHPKDQSTIPISPSSASDFCWTPWDAPLKHVTLPARFCMAPGQSWPQTLGISPVALVWFNFLSLISVCWWNSSIFSGWN